MVASTPFWNQAPEQSLQQVGGLPTGLSSMQARQRLAAANTHALGAARQERAVSMLLAQFKSPIILLLVFAAGLSLLLGERVDALIIFTILIVSALLSFWQEYNAANAVASLLKVIETKATVLRDGVATDIAVDNVVPGDLVILNAGDLIPGDCHLLEAQALFVDEAALTGETFPAEKHVAVLAADTPLSKRSNTLFLGTHVISGSAQALVMYTGAETVFGGISQKLRQRHPETEFERGVRRFGQLLLEITLMLVLAIFAINVYFARPVIDSFLFSLALAIGLTPQLLPAIISIVLAQGAQRMAREQVIVKQLEAIENFGSMDVLCSDKTGTLTEGVVQLSAAEDLAGNQSPRVLQYAALNATFESGFTNPIDAAIRATKPEVAGYEKCDEIPYDFHRKRLSVLVEHAGEHIMITKGALQAILACCDTAEIAPGTSLRLAEVLPQIEQRVAELSQQGYRVLGVAYRQIAANRIDKTDEQAMTLLGLLIFADLPKPDIARTIRELHELGVRLKIITGDSRLVAASISQQVGLPEPVILTGPELNQMSEAALRQRVDAATIFAEVEPNQKERIILALKQAGHVVGYMGDGINDASALHAADVGISVASAVDVAREAAQIVLLQHDLGVLVKGVREGRATFANTLKYVFVTTSANFGNMFSMAGISLFLPFLPLLPKQILLTNLLSDIPSMTIATDHVDPEQVMKPRRWDIRFIRNFMILFGLVSSIFDYATFGILLLWYRASMAEFRTAWFVESVLTELLILLIVRTWRPFYRSQPSMPLWLGVLGLALVTIVLPYSAAAPWLGFIPLPISLVALIAGIVLSYCIATELAKYLFFRYYPEYRA